MSADLIVRVDAGQQWITLNRPDAGNALTPTQRDRLIDLTRAADADPDIRVLVITATGRHFCGGADLRIDRPELDGGDDGPARRAGAVMKMIADGAQRLIAALLDCQTPVVAGVNGTAAGLGAQLALACDLVVAAEGASFIQSFVRRGLAPDSAAAYLLPRLVGLQRAKELVLLGDRVSAAEAHAMGLVNRVVAADELEATVAELAARLAAGPTTAIGLAKRLLNRSFDVDRDTAMLEEALVQDIVTATADAAEGIAAFVERREAVFRGW